MPFIQEMLFGMIHYFKILCGILQNERVDFSEGIKYDSNHQFKVHTEVVKGYEKI